MIIVSGTIGNHGVAALSTCEILGLETTLKGDIALLNHLVGTRVFTFGVHELRDPTRGRLAKLLFEISEQLNVTIEIMEPSLPVKPVVNVTCEKPGFDPL